MSLSRTCGIIALTLAGVLAHTAGHAAKLASPVLGDAAPASTDTVAAAPPAPARSIETITTAQTVTSADLVLGWTAPAGGGSRATSSSFVLTSVLGQSVTGPVSGNQLYLQQGFLQQFELPWACCLARGDIDHDGFPTLITDVVYLVDWMFTGGPEPPCVYEVDLDGDGEFPDMSDVVYLVSYLFQGGPAPIACP